MHDSRTENYSWPLPHRENILLDDVERIKNAFVAIDSELASLQASIDEKITAINSKITTIQQQKELKKYVLYLDADGDLCQDFIDDEESQDDTNIATDEEVEAMLDELYGNQ